VLVAQMKETSDRVSLAPRLAELDIPVLLIGADSDPFAPWRSIEQMAGLIPRAKAVQAKDAGHMIPLEQPQWLARQIAEFVS
jgi:pimeloyl-ACP methyl ester carboxylesterase